MALVWCFELMWFDVIFCFCVKKNWRKEKCQKKTKQQENKEGKNKERKKKGEESLDPFRLLLLVKKKKFPKQR